MSPSSKPDPSSPASIPLIQRIVAGSLLLIGILLIGRNLGPPDYPGEWDLRAFGSLPVQEGGRVKPIDTVARSTLMLISGRQSYTNVEGERVAALPWFTELIFNPQVAAERRIFRIDHPDVVGLLGFHNEERKYFSLAEIAPHFQTLSNQFSEIHPERQLRTTYQRALLKLQNAIGMYDNTAYALVPPPLFGEATNTYSILRRAISDTQRESGVDAETAESAANALSVFNVQFSRLAQSLHVQAIPPRETGSEWHNLGNSLISTIPEGFIDPVALAYADLSDAYQAIDPVAFNTILGELTRTIDSRSGEAGDKSGFEKFFNAYAPFAVSTILYFYVFMVAAFAWLVWPRVLGTSAFWLLAMAFAVHTFGMLARIYIQERPPVTNLYSSAIFVSWAAIPLCLLFEYRMRNGIASAAAAILGFCTLIIAHNLSLASGDTMEMMRAVLDSNFWLATHVPTVTIGYSATFLAGLFAAIFIVRQKLAGGLDEQSEKSINGMVYGTVCFALLFSFVGTVLGGIWADQSWGRFWGWDPKENGALMIVLWNALILHARWGKVAQPIAIMQLALVGNIITAWSWFGTNMLGVGLHSYGFMDAAFLWLMIFIVSQLLLIGIGFLPSRKIAGEAMPEQPKAALQGQK